MTLHRLFYKGQYLGDVSNPLSTMSHLWICQCCGQTFAERHCTTQDPFDGPLRYTVWQSLCSKCMVHRSHQYGFLVPEFHRRGDATNQLATIRATFLYELELFQRSQSASQVNPAA